MPFDEPSRGRYLLLKLLESRILVRDLAFRIQRRIKAYSTAIFSGAITGVLAIIAVHYRGRMLAALSAISAATLNFTNGHPRILLFVHVLLNSIPDATVFLLALAGLVYLMPNVVKKIEGIKTLRRGVACAVLIFCIFSVVVNAINREEQERRDDEHSRVERNSNERLYSVQSSLSSVQTFLVSSKGTTSEFDRRRGVLESLRAEYVLNHKDAPVSMMAGDSYPPSDWMNMRLKQLGEKFSYVPPARPQPQQQTRPPALPGLEIMVATGDDEAENVQFTSTKEQLKTDFWIDQERKCTKEFHCYPQRDLDSTTVEVAVGSKGWARFFVTIFDTGDGPIQNPYIGVSLANGRGVAINRAGDHHAVSRTAPTPQLEFKPPVSIAQILPFKITHAGYDFVTDLVVDPLTTRFSLVLRVYGDNLEARTIIVPFTVKSE